MKSDHTKQLLTRYHDGQTTDVENQQVSSLLTEDPESQQFLDELATLSNRLEAGYATPQISNALACRLSDIPHTSQQHSLTRLAGSWALAASVMLLFSGLVLFQYHANTTIDPDSWQRDRMALGQINTQYGIELTDNHKDLQLASLLIADSTEETQ